jgi:hypothetical protein
VKTQLSNEIDTSSKEAMYDRHCKNLLAYKSILAHIMKECVTEFKDFDVNYIAKNCIEGTPQISEVSVHRGQSSPEKIVGINTEDNTADEGTVYFDIRFVAVLPDTGENIRLIINVEAQNKYNPGYSLVRRGLYYCCRMISAQYETEFSKGNYDDIKKVYSIWVCTKTPAYARNTITRYEITERNVVGNLKIPAKNYDIMNVIMICLDKDSEDVKDNVGGILKLLRVLLSGSISPKKRKIVLSDEFDVEMTVNMGKEVDSMCNLSQGIKEDGIKIGIARGMEEGGILAKLKNVKNLMQNMKWTFDEAADALGFTEEEKEKISEMM